ncbi:MAG: hypothetical protein HY589_03665 [Candidatus Omnitrophica bacterium]|nr:hypothetical protein [Candidatus Omnitrophota bacterium]
MEYIRKDKFTKPHSPADVLNLALAKETSSYEFYDEVIRDTKNAALLDLLTELKDAEMGHIQKIKNMLSRTE